MAPPIRDRRTARQVRAPATTFLSSTFIHRGGPPPRNERQTRRNVNRYTSTSYEIAAMSVRDRIQGNLSKTRSPRLEQVYNVAGTAAMGRTHSTHKRHVPRTRPRFCDGRDMRSGLSFWEVELLCMQNSTSSLPFCAHSPKNTVRPKSMRTTILSRFCILNPALRAFAAVLQRDEGGFEFVASLLVRLQCCRCRVSRAEKYRNMLAHVSA